MIAAQPIADAAMQNRMANRRARLAFVIFKNRSERFVACIASFPSYIFPRPTELFEVETSFDLLNPILPDSSPKKSDTAIIFEPLCAACPPETKQNSCRK
ncbi:MAG: hypothetical protein GKS00_04935 [Alphaproteobacteria bacterium]|nr:hypothetical protein [Alphaproteobacteria bacterium]